MRKEFERVYVQKNNVRERERERWCPWEILMSREVDRARQISGAICQTPRESNNEQFISDHWSSTMAAYQRRRIPALSLVSQTGSTRSPGPQLVLRQARPGQARPAHRTWHWLDIHWWKHSMSTQNQCVNRPAWLWFGPAGDKGPASQV